MTREEAKDKMLTESVQYKNGLRTVALRKINNFIDKVFDDHEAQLEAKDKKARRIVAMLFWEWRKDKRIYENANKYTKETAELYVNCSELSFKKAYAMLKAN